MQSSPSPEYRPGQPWPWPRVGVRSLMLWIMALALAIAALRSASDFWADATFSMTLGLLMTAVLGVGYRRGSRQAFWLGFALFGWAYGLMSFGPWLGTWVGPHLVSTGLIKDLGVVMHRPPVFEGPIGFGTTADFASRHSYRVHENFRRIGHSLAALLVAVLGGFVAVRFSLKESQQSPTPAPPEVPTR